MKKLNTKGFGAVEVLLIVVLVGLIVGVGYYVYNSQKKTNTTLDNTTKSQSEPQKTTKKTTTQATKTTDPYVGWKTYDDANLSVKYPNGWVIKDMSKENGPTQWIKITSAEDPSIGINKGLGTAPSHKRLEFLVGPLPATGITTCRETCKVYGLQDLSTYNTTKAKLVISDWESQGHAQMMEVVDDPAATTSSNTYKLGVKINGKLVSINGSVAYDTYTSLGWIDDVPAFEKTQTFQDLVKLFNSLEVKS